MSTEMKLFLGRMATEERRWVSPHFPPECIVHNAFFEFVDESIFICKEGTPKLKLFISFSQYEREINRNITFEKNDVIVSKDDDGVIFVSFYVEWHTECMPFGDEYNAPYRTYTVFDWTEQKEFSVQYELDKIKERIEESNTVKDFE